MTATTPHHPPRDAIVFDRHPPPVADLEELSSACLAADGHTPFGEHTLISAQRAASTSHGWLTIEGVPAGIACAALEDAEDQWRCEVAVHPGHRGRGLATRLLHAVCEHVVADGGGVLGGWVYGQSTSAMRLAFAAGFEPVRHILFLRRDLPASVHDPLPAGIELSSFDPARDEDEWLALNNEAFDFHPDQGGWTTDDLRVRYEQAWFRTDDFLVARDQNGMAGFNWLKVMPPYGEIYIIAAAQRWRGRGLGRALVSAGLARMEQRGAAAAHLYVEANNGPANDLYRRVGFGLHHVDSYWAVELPAAGA